MLESSLGEYYIENENNSDGETPKLLQPLDESHNKVNVASFRSQTSDPGQLNGVNPPDWRA
jgi:hypothetical protein